MTDAIKTAVVAGVVAFLVVFAYSLVGGNQSEELGAGSRFPKGLSVDSTAPTAGQVRGTTLTATGDLSVGDDAVVSGGTHNVTSANTATSTAVVGCIQTYATSTATAVKLTLGKEASTATTTFYGGTSKGTLYWEYGTCPSL